MLPQPIFPPRPQSRLLWTHLPRYEASGEWVAQYKFNGKHVVIYVDPAVGECGVWGRRQDTLAKFTFTPRLRKELLSLNTTAPTWFAGELLHQKTTSPEYQSKFVLFDALGVGNSLADDDPEDLFIRQTQMERLAVLAEICRHPKEYEPCHGIALHITPNVWMAETFDREFVEHFHHFIHIPEIEGVMLRRRNGSLRNLCTGYWVTPDLIRVRKENKLYTH